MNLRAAAIVLRPRSVSEVFDLALRLCTGPALQPLGRLAAFTLLPLYALCLALRYAAGLDWLWVWVIAIAVSSVAQGPFTVAVGRILFSDQVSVSQALRLFWARLGSYSRAFIALTFMLAITGWTIVLIPWVGVRMLHLHEATLLEGLSEKQVWRRCGAMVAGRFDRGIAVVSLIMLARVGSAMVAESLGQALIETVLLLGTPFGSLWSDGGSPFALAGLFLSVPYVATARFLQYIDTRTRSDGWDIQLKFMALAAREQAVKRAA